MDSWPAIRSSIRLSGQRALSDGRQQRWDGFCRDLRRFFDRLQESASRLHEAEKARCGQDGVAAEVFLQIDLAARQVVLDKLFKYCEMDCHIFTGLLEMTVNFC